jgi:hypothetical protein
MLCPKMMEAEENLDGPRLFQLDEKRFCQNLKTTSSFNRESSMKQK